MTILTAPAYSLTFTSQNEPTGEFLREMDRLPNSSWHRCIVDGRVTDVRLGMKSGRVVEWRLAA